MIHFLTLKVRVTAMYEVVSGERCCRQLLFEGVAEGDYFRGHVLPGGVDTQQAAGGKGMLSARYILEGEDFQGQPCRIYVENEAELGSEQTKPTILTDSPALRRFEGDRLTGRLIADEHGVTIDFYLSED